MALTTTIFDGPHYRAEWIDGPHGGLCVTSKRKAGGVILRTSDEAWEWRNHIESAIDKIEANALCRALLEG